MTEDYLHYCWKFSKFSSLNLKTTEGQEISIVNKGFHNHDAGPDFSEAKIKIDDTLWAGSVEIHIKTSDWSLHKHQNDKRYNNVILHVVYEHDKDIVNQNNETIPVLELKGKIDEAAYFYYEQFLNNGNQLPCEQQFNEVPNFIKINMLDSVLVERLERKSKEIEESLKQNKGNWEETFHQFLFRFMGMKTNAEPMIDLAKKVPLQMLNKESNNLLSAEALLFGQAGMLNESNPDNEYHSQLRNEYLYLKQKHDISSMSGVEWKFSRMRPPNFPTLRIAQLAAIYVGTHQLFFMVRDKMKASDIALILDIEPSEFWKSHYSFKASKHALNSGKMGLSSLNILLINWVVPFAFAYGKSIGDDSYEKYAFELLESIKPEQNKITKKLNEVGLENTNAKDSQSLIQLHNNFCSLKKCLHCKIGNFLLK